MRSGWTRPVASSLAILGITALVVEAAVRWVIPQALLAPVPELYQAADDLGWTRRPDVRLALGEDVWFCTDARGDRVGCEAPPDRRCRHRVLAIGDSFVEAMAVSFEDTVWGRLERELGVCTEVAGVGGYGMGQYVALARERLAAPGASYDLVILGFYAGNDFTRRPTEISDLAWKLAREANARDATSGSAAALHRWLGARSHAYVAAARAWKRLQDPPAGYRGHGSHALRRSTLREQLMRQTAHGIELVAEEVGKAGSRLLVVVIPHDAQVLDPRGSRLVALMPKLEGDVDMDLVMREFTPRVRAIPRVDEVVDLLIPLRDRSGAGAWGSDRHLSPEGHRIWYEAIRDPVRRLIGHRAPRRSGGAG